MEDSTKSEQINENLLSKNYILGKKLGEGGSSKVYLVLNDILDQNFAAKIIDYSQMKSDCSRTGCDYNKIIDGEVKLMKSIVHIDGVVGYYNHFVFGNYVVIIMDFCPLGNLDQLIKRTNNNSGLEEKMISVILKQILCILYQVHELSIIHRDIKTSNILIFDENLKIKLSDFGLSNSIDDNQTSIRTETLMGTRRYLSPELSSSIDTKSSSIDSKSSSIDRKSSLSYSYSSDIWSVGVVLVDMIFGCGVISDQDLGCRNNIDFIVNDIASSGKTNSFNEVLKVCLSLKKEDRKSCQEILRLSPLKDARISFYNSQTPTDGKTNTPPLPYDQVKLKIGSNTYTYTHLPLICKSHLVIFDMYGVLIYNVSKGGYLNVDNFNIIKQFFDSQHRLVSLYIHTDDYNTITNTTKKEIYGRKISDELRRLLHQLRDKREMIVYDGRYIEYYNSLRSSFGECVCMYPYSDNDDDSYVKYRWCLYFRISDYQAHFSDYENKSYKCPCYK